MKNKFTKKHKHVLIINGTQGMAMLSLAAISGVYKYLKSSAPCARLLSSFDIYNDHMNQSSADSASCARALSRLWTGFAASIRHRASSISCARVLSLLGVLLISTSLFIGTVQLRSNQVSAATSNTLNFQGRLLTSTGGLVPDGTYNVQFNLYYVSSGGSSQWTETRTNQGGTPVTIQNGYYSVYLGDVTAFPGSIDWSEDLYLGMTVRGTGSCAFGSCTPADSEMTPRFKLTSVPYALRASNVASSSTNAASTNSDGISITTGNALGATSNSGSISIDVGSATGTRGAINLGTGTNAPSSILIGQSGVTTTVQGSLAVTGAGTALSVTNDATIGGTLGVTGLITASGGLTVTNGDTLTNSGATLNTAVAISDIAGGGAIGTAAATVNAATTFNISQTTASQTLSLPAPTSTTAGRIVYVNNVGSASFTMYGSVIAAGASNAFIWNGSAWVTTVSLSGSVVNVVGTLDSQTKSADGAVIASNAIYLQSADATYPGLVSTGSQSFAGAKTFGSTLAVTGDVTLTADLAVNGDDITSDGNLTINATGYVRIGDTGTPSVANGDDDLYVESDIEAGGSITGVGVNSGTGLIQGTGGATVTGTTQINATGAGTTTIGNASAGALVLQSSSTITTTTADNLANAFDLQEGTNNYINVNTTNSSENISFGNATTNPSYSFLGAGTSTFTGLAQFNGKVDVNTLTTADSLAQVAISTGVTTNKGLVIQAVAGQSANLLEVQSSVGGNYVTVSSTGTLGATNLNIFSGTGSGGLSKNYSVGTGGVAVYDVVVMANDGGTSRAMTTTTARDPRVFGVASNTVSSGSTTAIYISGNYLVTATSAAVAIGDQLVTSTVAGQVMTDNDATTGIIGIATTAKGAGASGQVGVSIRPVSGVTNPNFQAGNLTTTGTITSGLINGQTISSAANFTGTVTAAGLLTANAGATISGATTSINASSNFATNINTGTSTGAVSIGNSLAGAISLQSASTITTTTADNLANAFDLQEGTNNYINVNTTNSSENISFGNATTNPSFNFLGSGTLAVAGNQTVGGTLGVTGNVTANANLTVGSGAGVGLFTNNGATLNATLSVANDADGGALGAGLAASASVDVYTAISINQTTASQTITLPSPTTVTAGRILYISNVGSASFTLLGTTVSTGTTATLFWNGSAWTFAGADGNGILNQNAATQTATFRISGTGQAAGIDALSGSGLAVGGGNATSVTLGNTSNTTAISLQGAVAATYTIGDTGTTGQITVGRSTASNTISIGSANPAASATQTISIGNGSQTTASSVITVNILSGSAGSNGTATLNLAGNDRVTGINIGNVAPDAARTTNIATGNSAVVDTVNIGTGNTTAVGGKTINIGSGTPTGSGTNLITIGSTANASALTLQAGTGNINLNAATVATNQTTISLFNATATTVNAFGASTATTLGATTGTLTVRNANTTLGNAAGSGLLTNNGATLNTTLALGDLAAGSVGSAATTVDIYGSLSLSPTASGRTYTLPSPTSTTIGRVLYITNINGTNSFTIQGTLFNAGATATMFWNGSAWAFAGMDGGSNNYIQNQNSSSQTANFRISGTGQIDGGVLSTGLDVASAGTLSLGTSTATALTLGRASVTTTNAGSLTVTQVLTASSNLVLTTLGSADTNTYLCRNSSNQVATCTLAPISSALTDNVADSLDIQEGTNNYINVNTTNSSENISFGNATTNPSFNFLGSGTLAVAGNQTVGGTLGVTGVATFTSDLTVNGNTAIGNAITDDLTVTAAIQGATALVFDGATNDTNETTFSITDPTADRTITFQNNSGVVPLSTAGNTLFFTTTGATALTLPTSGTLTVNPTSGGYLMQVPTTTADNTITPTANSVVGLTVNGTSGTAATAVSIVQGGAATGLSVTSSSTGTGQSIALTNTSGTQTDGLLINRNGAGGTTTNLLNLTSTAGTATNGLTFTGTFTNLINSTNFTVTNAGNADFAGTLTSGTADAFQVNATGAVTAVGVNSGTGLIQGTGGATISGAATSINASSNFNTSINTGTSTGTVAIGNSASTTNILGVANINTSGATTTTIGNATAILNINGTTTVAAGFSQTGANTFGTGTGAVSLNGATSVTGTNTLTVGTGLTSLGGGLSVTAGNTTLTADLTVNGNTAIGNAITDDLTVTAAIQGATALVFDGVTNDTNETTFSITDPTADRTITFQNNSGVVPLSTAGNTLFFTTTGATALTLPTSGTLTVNPTSGGYLMQVPTTTADNTITPTANSVVGLTVNGTSGTAATAVSIVQGGAATALQVNGTSTGTIFELQDGGTPILTVVDGGNVTIDTDTFFLDTASDEVGIGTVTPGTTLEVAGSFSTSQNVNGAGSANYFGQRILSDTVNQTGLNNQVIFQPGATTTGTFGFNNILNLDSSAVNVNATAGYLRITTSASYTGTVGTAKGIEVAAPSIAGTNKFTNYYGIQIANPSTNGGNTSGTLTNIGLRVESITAAGGSGGTVTNRGIHLAVPDGSGAGTTSNRGLFITSGSAGGSNYAIYSDSAAQSYMVGNFGLGDTSPAALLTVGNNDLFQVSSAGATSIVPTTAITALTVTNNSITTQTASTITSTGILTTTGNLLTLTANSATTATGLLTLNGTALTSGYAQNINVNGTTSLTTGGALNIVGPTSTANLTGGNGLLRVSASGAFTTTAGVGGLLQVSTATVTGTTASIVGTGVMTGAGNLLTLTANSATTATGLLTVNGTGLTTGSAVTINAGTATALSAGGNITFQEITGTRTLGVQTRTTAATAGTNLTVQAGAAAASGAGTAGGILTLQGGSASGASGSANGGNVVITGGTGYSTGVKGLIVMDTTTYSAATVQNFTASAAITQANVDTYGSILISGNVAGWVATLPDPTITTTGRVIYITNSGSLDITLAANTVGTALSITLKPASTATMYWNGSDWTAAGASSSTDLQAAYNNTATSAGGAEIVLSSAGTGGLTIRNDATTAITGGLLEVQNSIGSNLFTVNNNATEYSNNGGAESSTFTMWTAHGTGPVVSRYTTAGNNIATGAGSVFVDTTSTANTGAKNTLTTTLTANLKYKVSYTVRHTSNTTTFTTLDTYFSSDGTTASTACATSSVATYNQWTRIDCTFTPTSVGASNAILIRHSDAVEHDFYVDNLSVTVSADANHAVDGDVDSALGTNWQAFDADGGAGTSAATRDTTNIYNTSGAVAVATTAGSAEGEGVRNNMSITPSVSTRYLVTFYAKSTTAFSDIKVGFLPAGGSSVPSAAQLCADYNTRTISTSGWTKVTCVFTTPSSGISDPDLVIYQGSAAARTFYVDALRITLNTNNSSNVQIGGGQKGGPTTLFTLDRSSGAPIADNNDAYLGSMYYDTSSGRIQCYEADGWGACGAAPDNYVNLNPEYAGAVLNGTGVGTMTADFCSNQAGVLQVNYVASTDPCFTSGDVKNYYKWTSPQSTQQTYSIYVTYQLPATFNGFSSDDTVQLQGRVTDTTNAAVTYQMYAKTTSGSLAQCGSSETTVVTSNNTWQTVGINGNEATGCSLTSTYANGQIIFKINLKANSNANAYVSTLSFTTTGR